MKSICVTVVFYQLGKVPASLGRLPVGIMEDGSQLQQNLGLLTSVRVIVIITSLMILITIISLLITITFLLLLLTISSLLLLITFLGLLLLITLLGLLLLITRCWRSQ